MSAPRLFELAVGAQSSHELFVVSLRGREEMSRPYRFDLMVEAPAQDLEDSVLGEPATLVLNGDAGAARTLRGVVESVRIESYFEGVGRAMYALRIVPKLATLRLSMNTRIFQDLSVPEIVDLVLEPRGIERNWKVARPYPKRDYRVQYGESDLAFVTRILAEEGIFYYFEPGKDGDVVVFGDIPEHAEPLTGVPAIAFTARDDGGTVREGIHAFALRRALRPEAARVSGFDYLRPALQPSAEADLSVLKADAQSGKAADGGRRIYDHDRDFDAFRVGDEAARVHLEQHRRSARRGEGTSSSPRLFPGCRFTLTDHAIADLNRAYTVARLTHEGKQAAPGRAAEGSGDAPVYENALTCVPAGVAFRPRRPKRVMRQLLDTATVVGPVGEEIHVDEHGRVKVQFHWDRDGKGDDKSSCWVRAIAPWAGATWGFQFIPRVGMEVVIGCLGGDPDRPIILGSAFNGTHVPPYALPAHKTRSGIRTQSSPGPHGYNELRFEDAANREQIFLKAQRDFDEEIAHDHVRHVGNDERITVGNTRAIDIEGDNVRTVKGNEIVTVEKNFVLHVFGRQQIIIEGGSAGGPNAGKGKASEAVDAPAAAAAELAAASGQPAPSSARSAAALAAAAKVNFLVEQLPDQLYDDGEKIRTMASSLKGASLEVAEQSEELSDHYVRILSEAESPGAPLPPAAVERAAALRVRAGLVKKGAAQLIEALESVLASPDADIPPELGKLRAASHELCAALVPTMQAAKQSAALTEQMAGTVVESAGNVVPVPRTTGSGQGGGGGDNTFTEIANGSEMTIKGKGEIKAPQGLKIVAGASTLELTNDGITLKGPLITIDATGVVDVKGHPIKLNC